MNNQTTVALTAVFALLLVSPAFGDDHGNGERTIIMQSAGTLMLNHLQDTVPPSGNAAPFSILEGKTIGSLGSATFKADSRRGPVSGPAEPCPAEQPIHIGFFADTFVFTFRDLSQLVAHSVTRVCISFRGTQDAVSEGAFVSGSGRFHRVTGGEFRLTDSAVSASQDGRFLTTQGTITGSLTQD